MLLLILGILSAVGLGLYQFGEHNRFEMVPDAKSGIFIIDRKSAAINYCTDKTCSLVTNGSLPSQIMGNPAALMAMQGAIMGAPAAVAVAKPGAAPNGMQANIAASGNAKPATDNTTVVTADTQSADEVQDPATEAPEDAAPDEGEASSAAEDGEAAPDGFSFD